VADAQAHAIAISQSRRFPSQLAQLYLTTCLSYLLNGRARLDDNKLIERPHGISLGEATIIDQAARQLVTEAVQNWPPDWLAKSELAMVASLRSEMLQLAARYEHALRNSDAAAALALCNSLRELAQP
jgi:hypothetical protein